MSINLIIRTNGSDRIANWKDLYKLYLSSPTDGLTRGMEVIDMGAALSVPVGGATLGRIFNVLGEPVDNLGPVDTRTTSPIHKSAPAFIQLDTKLSIFETGIKVVDLLAPYHRGGKIRLFGGAGVGKTVLVMELINNIASRRSLGRVSVPVWLIILSDQLLIIALGTLGNRSSGDEVGPVAQRIRAHGYEPRCRGFESLLAHNRPKREGPFPLGVRKNGSLK
ncbi:hypothetical protein ES288_A07G189900v1 [Gossypium darwinii]|uniref:H(+)-transporting two-sector ATPase n=1 Tax=Gossypium darwinii TaxID=34276 RepID=A0A5D2FZ57_GOSDA|nr:hypothetical protein ES288_A07G189900v1 [Gossypium darwinii]